jgi:hypothetical protein
VTAALKRLAHAIFSPLLGWLSSRFDELRERLDVLVDGQAELTRLNRTAVQQRDEGADVVSRAVGVQAAMLESIRDEQARLVDEVRALRDAVRELESARDHAVD